MALLVTVNCCRLEWTYPRWRCRLVYNWWGMLLRWVVGRRVVGRRAIRVSQPWTMTLGSSRC